MSARHFIESAEEARLILARTPRTAEMALLVIDAQRALEHYERVERSFQEFSAWADRTHAAAVHAFDQACATMEATSLLEPHLPAAVPDPAQLELVA